MERLRPASPNRNDRQVSLVLGADERGNQSDSSSCSWLSDRSLAHNQRKMLRAFDWMDGQDPERRIYGIFRFKSSELTCG